MNEYHFCVKKSFLFMTDNKMIIELLKIIFKCELIHIFFGVMAEFFWQPLCNFSGLLISLAGLLIKYLLEYVFIIIYINN